VAPYIPLESLTIMWKWRPPPEPHKPYLPYTRGTKIHISKHAPPEPFDSEYARHEGQRLLVSEDLLHSTTLVELCFQQPPTEGERATHFDSRTKVLEITDPIKVKDGHGAQIFLCTQAKMTARRAKMTVSRGFVAVQYMGVTRETCSFDT
jgi:hypothetical protein